MCAYDNPKSSYYTSYNKIKGIGLAAEREISTDFVYHENKMTGMLCDINQLVLKVQGELNAGILGSVKGRDKSVK